MIALVFAQLQAALRDDLPFASSWQGVMALDVEGDRWYVSTTGNIPAPVCVRGEWAGGPDLTIHVASQPAWVGLTTAPETIPAMAAAGQITTDDEGSAAYALARLGAMMELRMAYVAEHPI
jgi:hypothetical protein